MNKSWKIAHANFRNIYEKLNKNYTNISMLYEITLFLKKSKQTMKTKFRIQIIFGCKQEY